MSSRNLLSKTASQIHNPSRLANSLTCSIVVVDADEKIVKNRFVSETKRTREDVDESSARSLLSPLASLATREVLIKEQLESRPSKASIKRELKRERVQCNVNVKAATLSRSELES